MQIKDFHLFFAVSIWKCPDWYETRTWRVTLTTASIYQVQTDISKHVEKIPDNFEKSR